MRVRGGRSGVQRWDALGRAPTRQRLSGTPTRGLPSEQTLSHLRHRGRATPQPSSLPRGGTFILPPQCPRTEGHHLKKSWVFPSHPHTLPAVGLGCPRAAPTPKLREEEQPHKWDPPHTPQGGPCSPRPCTTLALGDFTAGRGSPAGARPHSSTAPAVGPSTAAGRAQPRADPGGKFKRGLGAGWCHQSLGSPPRALLLLHKVLVLGQGRVGFFSKYSHLGILCRQGLHCKKKKKKKISLRNVAEE